MHRSYADIVDRLGPPIWWDDHGVPRYCDFKPWLATVYKRYVAYMDIRCHGCDATFLVAVSRHEGELRSSGWQETKLPTADSTEWFHYGDPPRHDCVGDTMNVWTQAILEFWDHAEVSISPGRDRWVRRTEVEFVYPGEGA